jgi:hypothetical protein
LGSGAPGRRPEEAEDPWVAGFEIDPTERALATELWRYARSPR